MSYESKKVLIKGLFLFILIFLILLVSYLSGYEEVDDYQDYADNMYSTLSSSTDSVIASVYSLCADLYGTEATFKCNGTGDFLKEQGVKGNKAVKVVSFSLEYPGDSDAIFQTNGTMKTYYTAFIPFDATRIGDPVIVGGSIQSPKDTTLVVSREQLKYVADLYLAIRSADSASTYNSLLSSSKDYFVDSLLSSTYYSDLVEQSSLGDCYFAQNYMLAYVKGPNVYKIFTFSDTGVLLDVLEISSLIF